MLQTLYITGAGVSAESGIPTFRGEDGFWTIGSANYTPQEMATRAMYKSQPAEFLKWYYHRFVTYRNHGPNQVHQWLSDKNVITQNIDGLDGKAGNNHFIAIHGRVDQVTPFHTQGEPTECFTAPWDEVDESRLAESLLALFKIARRGPEKGVSLKPYVLLFDEYYTDLYRISEAQSRMYAADRIVFMGTSFSVNITQMALEIARHKAIPIEVVDPNPAHLLYKQVSYHRMTAREYIASLPTS
ncbi:SIR2 family NAD-dependent protein deacylase [Pseudoalteromonas maricaloris]|uniref:protein acetyllysine N-acetyltransferase n=1 Tax=Pseudoalteromonas maricaloris TaxID=184924 RepID=A0A8I2H170_9GAMM|nr:Sir2 family NAD-dependent protein deacetylase [Pseudoalteromonas maricaloris]NLR22512.1 sirtuin [Pseudoalteromonas maricaloris]WOX29439.1 Sir2 family NAD-dependent protein deacetylase [Pseudoalteromonas maricaloris]